MWYVCAPATLRLYIARAAGERLHSGDGWPTSHIRVEAVICVQIGRVDPPTPGHVPERALLGGMHRDDSAPRVPNLHAGQGSVLVKMQRNHLASPGVTGDGSVALTGSCSCTVLIALVLPSATTTRVSAEKLFCCRPALPSTRFGARLASACCRATAQSRGPASPRIIPDGWIEGLEGQ